MAKIALWGRHGGLIDMMFDLLQHHEVRIQEPYLNYPLWQGNEELYVYTFAYDGLKTHPADKPFIVYATDPAHSWQTYDFKNLQKRGTIVLAEDCYLHNEFFPIEKVDYTIPFAMNYDKYHAYTGEINKVLIVNRKVRPRWSEVVHGATGINYTLEEFLGDIPFEICNIANQNQYRDTLGRYKVMFYFSNSPYSIVMFEGLTIGMPMVGYNHFNVHTYSPVEKYLINYGTGMKEIREMLQKELTMPAREVTYNNIRFNDAVKQWDDVINKTIGL